MATAPANRTGGGASRPFAISLAYDFYWALAVIANPASLLIVRRSARLGPFGLEAGTTVMLAVLPALGIAAYLAGLGTARAAGDSAPPRGRSWARLVRDLCRMLLPLLLAVNFLKALKLHARGPALIAGALLALGTLAVFIPPNPSPPKSARAPWPRRRFRWAAVFLLIGLEVAVGIEAIRWTRKGYYQGPIKHPLVIPLLQPLLSVNMNGAVLSDGARHPDFGGARFEGSRLLWITARGLNFRMARFERAVLNGSDFEESDFERANLIEIFFHHGRAPGANFSRAIFFGASTIGCDLRGASYRWARLDYAKFIGIDGRDSDWTRADFFGKGGYLYASNLRNAVFKGANLDLLNMNRSDFTNADFAGASLRGATLWRAVLKGANLENADLRGIEADIDQLCEAATLSGARLDPPLAEALMRKYPRLFQPRSEPPDPVRRRSGSRGTPDSPDD